MKHGHGKSVARKRLHFTTPFREGLRTAKDQRAGPHTPLGHGGFCLSFHFTGPCYRPSKEQETITFPTRGGHSSATPARHGSRNLSLQRKHEKQCSDFSVPIQLRDTFWGSRGCQPASQGNGHRGPNRSLLNKFQGWLSLEPTQHLETGSPLHFVPSHSRETSASETGGSLFHLWSAKPHKGAGSGCCFPRNKAKASLSSSSFPLELKSCQPARAEEMKSFITRFPDQIPRTHLYSRFSNPTAFVIQKNDHRGDRRDGFISVLWQVSG